MEIVAFPANKFIQLDGLLFYEQKNLVELIYKIGNLWENNKKCKKCLNLNK